MPNSSESTGDDRSSTWWLRGRTLILFAVLSLELSSLSLCCDLQPLQQSQLWFLRTAAQSAAVFRILAVAFVAFVVIERKSVSSTLDRWTDLASQDRGFAWKLAGHLIAAASFAWLSISTLRDHGIQATPLLGWLWLATGGLAIALWLAALAPVRFWTSFGRSQSVSVVAVSSLIGGGIYLLMLVSDRHWFRLNDLTLAACERILALVSRNVIFDSASRTLGTSQFHVEVAPVCSGLEGIVLVTAALSLFLILFRNELRFPHALAILPIGIITIWICNVVRIVVLILIGSLFSPAVATGGFHSQAGWIGFAVVTIGLAYLTLRVPFFAHLPSCRTVGKVAINNAEAYLLPLLGMIAAAMIAAALSSGFDTLYPLKIIVGVAVLACFLPTYRSIPWSWSWMAATNGVAVFVIWLGLEHFASQDGTQLASGLQQLPPTWAMVWLAFRTVGSTAVVPLAEELAFRGYLMRRISSADFDAISFRNCSWLAVLISSLLFGLLHGRWFAGTLAGIFYALATRRRNMLCDAVTAHSVTNGLIASYVLLSGSWKLWA